MPPAAVSDSSQEQSPHLESFGSPETERRNFPRQVIEGSLFVGSGSLISDQIVIPSVVERLGGSYLMIGFLPIIAYSLFFLPQIFSANLHGKLPRKHPALVRGALYQRLPVVMMALSLLALPVANEGVSLVFFLFFYIAFKFISGVISPVWFDFFVKITNPVTRGRLIGIRSAIGGGLSFLNSLVLTALLAALPFPFNFASVFVVAAIVQFASLHFFKQLEETEPSVTAQPLPVKLLMKRLFAILRENDRFRKFLIASSLVIAGSIPSVFFIVIALKEFALPESSVGLFTIASVVAQAISAGLLGYLADVKGPRLVLLVCAAGFLAATLISVIAPHGGWFVVVFALSAVPLGAEMMNRYLFAAECAPHHDRAIYIGLMNIWFAPFYITSLAGGMLVEALGYKPVFLGSMLLTLAGFILLYRLPERRRVALRAS